MKQLTSSEELSRDDNEDDIDVDGDVDEEEDEAAPDEDEDNAVISDRCLMDSAAQSQSGVNIPLNSLPKLSRHRKSDLLATELEGNPQKPSGISVHFSKRRITEAQ